MMACMRTLPLTLFVASLHLFAHAACAQTTTSTTTSTTTTTRPTTWTASGWIEASYNASSASRTNLPVGFFYQPDSTQLNQAWLVLDKPLVKDGPNAGPGFHLDVFAGTDYVFTRAFGLLSRQTSEIGVDPLQFYISGHIKGFAKGTDLKLGRFSSPISAEYNSGPLNELPSHTYSFIFDPFTHTGLYSETALSDRLTLLAGLVTGSDVFVPPGVRGTGIGGLRYTDKDPKKSAELIAIIGPGTFNREFGFNNVDVVDLLLTYPLNPRLLMTFEAIVGWEGNVPGMGDVNWGGAVGYLTWNLNAHLDGTVRVELFNDEQGNRTGFAGDYRAATAGLKWQPDPHWILRPELRHDDHSGAAPFEGRNHLTTATIDAIYRF